MANLYSGSITTGSAYLKVSDASRVIFTSGTTYILQIQNPAYIIESVEVPTKGGFLILNSNPFSYTPSGTGDLYIKSLNTTNIVNIAS